MTDAPSRITSVRFSGLRTATKVSLDLTGLTVLIGPNGVGKSTLIEGLELLRRTTAGDDFVRSLHDDHGGPSALLSHGARHLELSIGLTIGDDAFDYAVVLRKGESGFEIAHEMLTKRDAPLFVRDGTTVAHDFFAERRARRDQPFWSVRLSPEIDGLMALMRGIDVHTGFLTQAAWIGREQGRDRGARGENVVQATSRLARGGANLANAFHTLRNRDDWEETLETIRLVVDQDIRDVMTPASASGGSIGLAVKYRTGTVPAFALSDGTLALLSLVAITVLDGGDPPRSLLVLDEPDLHLHPSAIRYVVALLERCAKKYPVVIATHSDQLLDCLSDPARSTVLCELDEHRHLRLQRPDAAQLAKWLPKYRGVGQLRAEGYGSLVFPPASSTASKS